MAELDKRLAEAALREANENLELRVELLTAQLARANRILRAEIAERKRMGEELCRNRESVERLVVERTARLQELVNEVEHFSFTITHDMRAPLRALQGFASLLDELCGGCAKPQTHEYRELIRTSAARMDRLITGALQNRRTLEQEFPLQPVDVAASLRGLIESYPDLRPPKAQIRIDGMIPPVLGNEAGLTQCLSNLLGNAVKFMPPGRVPEVRIWAEYGERGGAQSEPSAAGTSAAGQCPADRGHQPPSSSTDGHPSGINGFVRIWVEDNGIGIPQAEQGKLFQMFHRATAGFDGSGVGLALVKKVAERMGGRVGVESEASQGSRFWLELRSSS